MNCNSDHFSRQNLKFIFHCAERMHRIKSLTMFHIATILPRGVITFTFINHSDNNSESRRHVCIFPHFPRVHAYTRASIYRDSDRVPDRAMNYRERTVTRLHRRCIIPAYRDTWLAVNWWIPASIYVTSSSFSSSWKSVAEEKCLSFVYRSVQA